MSKLSSKSAYLYNNNLFADPENLLLFGGALPQHAGRIDLPAGCRPGQRLFLAHRHQAGPQVVNKLDKRTLSRLHGLVSRIHSVEFYAERFG